MGVPLHEINWIYLVAFKILSLSLIFDILILIFFGVDIFVFILFGLSILPRLEYLFPSPG